MKSGEPVKETPVEREASGRRPKRKCLQWHPVLSKKVLDISEEEEQEVEEGHKGALLICEKSQCQKVECGGTEEEEEVLSEQRARRPMNAFLLFCKRHRSLVRREHPRLDNRGATKTLADWWAVLEPTEKQKYTDMAKEYKDAFLKANPGYKWCPPTNKPAKNSLPNASTQKKLWLFPTEPSKDCVFAKEVPKTDSTPQLNFAMADPTNMGGLSMLLLAGEHAMTARERVFSSSSYSSMPEGKQSGQSALFQLAEMCLASEAGKIESLTPQQEEYSSTTNSTERGTSDQVINTQGTPILPVSSLSSPFSASTSSASGSPSVLSQSNTQRKKKKRRKDKAEASTFDSKLAGMSKKTSKRCHSPESDPESIILNTEAMAKGSLNVEEDKEGMPKKKERQAECKKSSLEGSSSLRKPPKVKESPMGRVEKDQPVDSKRLSQEVHSPEREMEKPILKTDPPVSPEEPLISLSHTSLPIKTEEKTEAKADTVGSRKSERTCKGALYKTLVLEGMLTSLRASVDRGKRGSGRGTAPDIEGSWTKESWAFAQTGASNKKLKKSRSKDESIPSLGILEEEFEKKFNSLPRYSPLTFDKKGTLATENGTVDQPKGSSPSQKKNLFHKIVSKHKHKREKPKTLDKVIQYPTVLGTVQEFSRSAPCGVLCLEMLVGSQKRKARKRKITHLVRTADGNVSAAGVEEKTKQIQDQDAKPLPQKTEGNEDCFAGSGTQGACIVTTDKTGTSGLPAFLSLAALAEVAAMEIPNRGHYPVSVSCEGQSKEVVQKAMLISCADQ